MNKNTNPSDPKFRTGDLNDHSSGGPPGNRGAEEKVLLHNEDNWSDQQSMNMVIMIC